MEICPRMMMHGLLLETGDDLLATSKDPPPQVRVFRPVLVGHKDAGHEAQDPYPESLQVLDDIRGGERPILCPGQVNMYERDLP
jgi:hypothetical protein